MTAFSRWLFYWTLPIAYFEILGLIAGTPFQFCDQKRNLSLRTFERFFEFEVDKFWLYFPRTRWAASWEFPFLVDSFYFLFPVYVLALPVQSLFYFYHTSIRWETSKLRSLFCTFQIFFFIIRFETRRHLSWWVDSRYCLVWFLVFSSGLFPEFATSVRLPGVEWDGVWLFPFGNRGNLRIC